MRRAVRAACALLCALGTLHLTASVSARTTSVLFAAAAALELPRSLTDSNAALDAARTLRTEMDALATQTAGLTRDARVNFRRVAFDLLFHGAAAPFDSQAMVIAGLRMVAVRAELDQTLSNPIATEIDRKRVDRKAVDEALLRFVQASDHGLEPLPAPDHPEVTLARILLPLEQAVAMLESRTLHHHQRLGRHALISRSPPRSPRTPHATRTPYSPRPRGSIPKHARHLRRRFSVLEAHATLPACRPSRNARERSKLARPWQINPMDGRPTPCAKACVHWLAHSTARMHSDWLMLLQPKLPA